MFQGKKILAIIPARGGSKRIKNKNIINFKGEPMIVRTLKVAKECKYIDKIVVSTDSKKILKICKKHGVDTPFLRESAYDDKSSPHLEADIRRLMYAIGLVQCHDAATYGWANHMRLVSHMSGHADQALRNLRQPIDL